MRRLFVSLRLQHGLGSRNDVVDSQLKLLGEIVGRPRCAESIDALEHTRVSRPSKRGAGLDDEALVHRHRRRQHGGLVLCGLVLKDLPARHRYHTNSLAVGAELLGRVLAQVHLGPGSDENGVRVARAAVARQNVRSLLGILVACAQLLRLLTGESQNAGRLSSLDSDGVHSRSLGRVGRAHHVAVRHRAERSEVLNRLMGGSIFSQEDRVVRHHVDDAGLRERRHAHGAAHVIREDEERGAVRDETTLVQTQPVANRAHAVLAHTKAEIAVLHRVLLEVPISFHDGEVGRSQVGRATDETRHDWGKRIEHHLRQLSGSHGARVFTRLLQSVFPAGRKRVVDALVLKLLGLLGVLGLVLLKAGSPFGLEVSTLLDLAVSVLGDLFGDLERPVLPAEVVAGRLHLVSAEGSTVHGVRVDLVRRAVADERGHIDEGRLVSARLRLLDGGVEPGKVSVALRHVDDLPPVRLVALEHVLGERDVRAAIDGDGVVIVERDELAESPVTRERGRLGGDSLHHAAVAENAVGVVVDELRSVWLVERRGEVRLGSSEADGVADALSQRAGGDLNPWGLKVLRMPWRARVDLAELLDVLDGDAVVAKEVEQRVLQH
mmetsp:Transcript_11306/g.30450  ORF Transcript_11306/g.30450 Transcript_11306/m.30450 type:complete len:607 (-) Transcript_11306:469-2289(-)